MTRLQLTIAYKGGAVVQVEDVLEFEFKRGHQIKWVTSGRRTTMLHAEIEEIVHVHATRKLRPLTSIINAITTTVNFLKFWK